MIGICAASGCVQDDRDDEARAAALAKRDELLTQLRDAQRIMDRAIREIERLERDWFAEHHYDLEGIER